jgi:hypothetical protein
VNSLKINQERTRIIPVNWSTYVFSVSIKSVKGLVFEGFPSAGGLSGIAEYCGTKGDGGPVVRL